MSRSRIVPYDPNETASDRHWRRLGTNLEARAEVEAWCATRGIALAIHNDGQHWQFRLPSGKRIDWWPSSAKFVVDEQWRRDKHVHDYQQTMKLLARLLEREIGR